MPEKARRRSARADRTSGDAPHPAPEVAGTAQGTQARHTDRSTAGAKLLEWIVDFPLMCFAVDRDGKVLAVNEYGASALGYRVDELEGGRVSEVVFDEDWTDVSRQLQTAAANVGQIHHWRFRKVRKDGSLLWVHESVRTIVGPDGQPVLLIACEDVTSEVEAERRIVERDERIRALGFELEQAEEEERRRIAAGLHDDPAQKMVLAYHALGIALGDETPPPVREAIREASQLVGQALEGLRSLMFDLSAPTLHEFGLEAVVEELAEQLQEKHGIRFTVEATSTTKASPTTIRVYRCIRELLSNVVRHAEAETATVRIAKEGDRLRVIVADDGVGFGAASAAEQVRNKRAVGLFTVRERLAQVGGKLELHSRPGEGTRAIIEVPL